MTNEEAIKMITDDMRLHHDSLSGTYRKALKMAIEALKAQDVPDTNVGDTISRQAAIDAIVNTVSEIRLHDNSEVARYGATFRQHEIIDIIEGMPSVQPDIIRCKECLMHSVCKFELGLGQNGYCSQAERRTDEL